MKELVQIWSRVTGRRYSAVNTNDRELRDFSNNRWQTDDLHGNLSECEGLNRFSHGNEFHDKKNVIINRLFEKRKKGQITRQPKSAFLFLMLGFFAMGAGLFILFLHPYDFLFKLKTVMSDGGEIYEMWRKPQIDLYCKVYLFNVTNSKEFLSGKDKNLKFQEVGPYVYKENLEHTDVKFNENGTLSTVPIHPLIWEEELSQGNKEDDKLVLPNIALLSIANVVAVNNPMMSISLNMLIKLMNSQPLVEMTAKEFMMGYKSGLLSLGNQFMPGWISFEKLGLIDRMYDFTGDFETVFTGESDVTLSGLIDTYKGVTDLPQWEGHHCSNIQYASDGTKFKGGLSKNESLLFYRKSLCRAAIMVPVKSGLKHDFRANMYTFEDNLLDNGQFNEKNKCFCRKGVCLPAGLIDVTDCYYGFPIALSYPHFYQGDAKLFNKVEGLTPSQAKHETRFWIQPESGLPLEVSSKFQINMALKDISSISHVEKFSNMVLPMLWFDITMSELPTSMANKFKLYLNVLPVVERCALYGLLFIGVISIVAVVTALTCEIIFRNQYDHNGERLRNIIIGSDMWVENERSFQSNNLQPPEQLSAIECPASSDESFESERRPSGFLKTHSDIIKELSLKLGDKVYESVGSAKTKVKDEFIHVRQIFKDMESRKNSLIPSDDENNINEAYKSDTTEGSESGNENPLDYCNYLEVVEDDLNFNDNK